MKIKLINDNFQNYKRYNIPKAQLVIADIPYNLGVNAYASVRNGMLMAITKRAKAKKRQSHFS
jgi:site-specific DNA-methyltransferase (adenine-specific)